MSLDNIIIKKIKRILGKKKNYNNTKEHCSNTGGQQGRSWRNCSLVIAHDRQPRLVVRRELCHNDPSCSTFKFYG